MRRRDVVRGLGAVVAVAAVGAALGACAARGPEAVGALDMAPPVAVDRARLVFIIPDDLGVLLVGEPNVFVNRRKVGRLVRAGVFWTDVVPGRQIITTSAEQSQALAIQAAPGETLYLAMGEAAGDGSAWPLQATQARLLSADDGQAALVGKRLVPLVF